VASLWAAQGNPSVEQALARLSGEVGKNKAKEQRRNGTETEQRSDGKEEKDLIPLFRQRLRRLLRKRPTGGVYTEQVFHLALGAQFGDKQSGCPFVCLVLLFAFMAPLF
jgi:hypothetical protein